MPALSIVLRNLDKQLCEICDDEFCTYGLEMYGVQIVDLYIGERCAADLKLL